VNPQDGLFAPSVAAAGTNSDAATFSFPSYLGSVEHTEYFASGHERAVFVVSTELAVFGMLCIDNIQRDVLVSYNQSKHALLCLDYVHHFGWHFTDVGSLLYR